MLLVTGLLAVGVVFLLAPNDLTFLKMLEFHRASIIAHPETRDLHPTITFYRQLDKELAPDARIFFSGIVGPDNRHLFYYYFARSCLFPREVEISLDHKADFSSGAFKGIDCASPEQLRTNGYDVMLKVDSNSKVSVLPLTKKGALKQ